MVWTWELYLDARGEVPKDLLAFFVRFIPEGELPSTAPTPVLTPSETKRLQVNLRYLCDKGLASLNSDIFEKLEDDLYFDKLSNNEFRMTKSEHNPRFILTTATPQCFVVWTLSLAEVLHAFMKKYDGAIRDRDKEPARLRLRELNSRKGR